MSDLASDGRPAQGASTLSAGSLFFIGWTVLVFSGFVGLEVAKRLSPEGSVVERGSGISFKSSAMPAVGTTMLLLNGGFWLLIHWSNKRKTSAHPGVGRND